ncbi:MAG: hypothetical protein VW600_17075 [Ferrovibrio sp.]
MSVKVAIVTGAGKGMGAGILKKLAADGYNVAARSPVFSMPSRSAAAVSASPARMPGSMTSRRWSI